MKVVQWDKKKNIELKQELLKIKQEIHSNYLKSSARILSEQEKYWLYALDLNKMWILRIDEEY